MFCKMFSDSSSRTVAVLLPRQAGGTLRMWSTKPLLEVTALPSICHLKFNLINVTLGSGYMVHVGTT